MSELSQIERVFFAALEKQAPQEREEYLASACGHDAELRQRVERLLEGHLKAGSFLDHPAVDLHPTADEDSDAAPQDPLIGSQIGPYKLLEKIGEGGMGVVYMADQQSPVRRRVALKIIKPGMDSRQITARFEAERQALAMMDHPNIARVLDANTTSAGLPYFVMELVRGIPITEYCDEHTLPVHERLELLIQVCHAVQHAHQKGIIHRDIKPSNVLVTLLDGRAVPKVIDFGIAKALNQQLTDKTLFTNFAQMIGTPLYMSPEQAAISGSDVDTRADIYSLGVLLYELLTGVTPFDKQRLREAAFEEIRRIIREEEPERPSTRISTAGEKRTTIAAHRRADPNRLSDLVRGDLDWIVMKSLEKDRARRYETVDGLARDIGRYLSDQPVEACPPSVSYRFRKFARRNRTSLVTATLLLSALTIGGGASAWQAIRATRAERVAEGAQIQEAELRRQEQIVRAQAETASKEAIQQRDLAETRNQQVERMLYAAQLERSQSLWERGDLPGAWESLDACDVRLRGWEHDYLHTLFTSGCLTLKWPDELYKYENFPAVSPSGRRLAGRARDESESQIFKVWDLTTGLAIATLEQNEEINPSELIFSPDGKLIAGSSSTGTLLWDAETGRQVLKLDGPAKSFLNFSADGQRIAGYGDKRIAVWDTSSGKELLSLQCRADSDGTFPFLSPDGEMLATYEIRHDERSHPIKLWNATTGEELNTISGHSTFARDVAFSPDGMRIASIANNDIKIWEASTGKELLAIRQPGKQPYDYSINIAFSPDGRSIASTNSEGVIWLWDASDGHPLSSLKGHRSDVEAIFFAPDGKQLVSSGSGQDRIVKIWKLDVGQRPLTLPRDSNAHDVGASSVAFSPDGSWIVTNTGEKTLMKWDASSGNMLLTLAGHEGRTSCVAVSPDGLLIASGSEDKTTRIWDARSGNELRSLKGHDHDVNCVAFSPDGQYLASGSQSGVRIWKTSTGEEWRALKSTEELWGPSSISFSPDGQRLVIPGLGQNNTLAVLWDLSSGETMRTFDKKRARLTFITCVAFSPDGLRIAGATSDNTVLLWDVETGQESSVLRGHTSWATSVTFSPDGKRIASGGMNGMIKIWEASSGQELLTLRGHTEAVNAIAFSPDGKRLASASVDVGVRIWEATRSASSSQDDAKSSP